MKSMKIFVKRNAPIFFFGLIFCLHFLPNRQATAYYTRRFNRGTPAMEGASRGSTETTAPGEVKR